MIGYALGFVIVVTLASLFVKQRREIGELKDFIEENW